MTSPFHLSTWREAEFAHPAWLWLLLLLPLLALLRGARGRGPAVAFSSLHLLSQLAKPGRTAWGWFAWSSLYLTLALGIIALAQPRQIHSHDNVTSNGIEIMLSIDVSLSMAIEDFKMEGEPVNRLTVAKKVTKDFIKGRPSDRIGVVAFAGRPYLASPLTLDHDWLTENLKRVQMNLVEDGTAIGSSLVAATRRLDDREAKSKVIVLLTDGSNNSGNVTPLDAARIAATEKIRIYTICIGTPGYHQIPVRSKQHGQVLGIRQEFDTESMQKIADITDGRAFMATDTTALEKIFKTIDTLEKTEIKRQTLIETEELFPWVLGAALILQSLGMILKQTLTRETP